MRLLRIGVVGLSFSNFEAKKHKVWENSSEKLKVIASQYQAELILWSDILESAEDSKRAANYFENQKIDFLLIQASSFFLGDVIYPLLALEKNTGLWFVPEPSYGGELQLNSLTGFNLATSICKKFSSSVQTKWFFGTPGEPSFDEPFSITLLALKAVVTIPGSRIGQIGEIVPTFDNLVYDERKLRESLGVEVVQITIDELFNCYKQVSQSRIGELVHDLKQRSNRVLVEDIWLEKTARVIGGMQMLKEEYKLDAAAVKCWPEFQSELDMAPCAALAFANDIDFPSGCEGDLVGALSMLISHRITGTAPTINDPVAFDEGTGTIQMWHCGPGPASWADDEGQTLAYHHTLNRRKSALEPLSGVSSDISFRQGAVTVMRLEDDGKQLFVFEANVVKGPGKPFAGSGGWFGEFTSDKQKVSIKDFVETVGAYGIEHHYPVCRGHIENVYREMASWMGLQVLPFKQWKPYKQ